MRPVTGLPIDAPPIRPSHFRVGDTPAPAAPLGRRAGLTARVSWWGTSICHDSTLNPIAFGRCRFLDLVSGLTIECDAVSARPLARRDARGGYTPAERW